MPRLILVGAAVCLLAACSDNTDPGGGIDGPAGLWNTTISGIDGYSTITGGPAKCVATFVMWIDTAGTGAEQTAYARVPYDAPIVCGPGAAGIWLERGNNYFVTYTSDSVTLFNIRGAPFLVAGFTAGTITGNLVDQSYRNATIRAVRRAGGTDPNRAPFTLDLRPGWRDLEVSDTTTFAARAYDAYLEEIPGATVSWSSSAPAIATVSAAGLVQAVQPGTATITATVGTISESEDFTVLPPPASLQLSSAPDSLIVSWGGQVFVNARDAGGQILPGRRFYWTSSNPGAATVGAFSDVGDVTAVGPGPVTITARSGTLTATATFQVLPAVAEIVVSGAPGNQVLIGTTVQLTATTRDDHGNVLTGRPIAWSAISPAWIDVNETGLVAAIRGGPGQVYVSAEAITTTVTLIASMDAPLTALAAGDGHTCGLTQAGRVYCWGHADLGRLGGDRPEYRSTAVPVASAETFASLAAGAFHTCALNAAGAAFCWGQNALGQLGHSSGTIGQVLAVSGGVSFDQLAGGAESTCGLTSAQDAYCWGGNQFGQLGRGTSDDNVNPSPAIVIGGHHFTEIRTGADHACGLTAAGAAWCWGINDSGQLGLGSADNQPHPTPVHAAPALTFTTLAAGGTMTCGITTGGPVYCWGFGQLAPGPVDPTTGYVKLTAGREHFCRLDAAGHMSCWRTTAGYNLEYVPSETVADFTAGLLHTCALIAGGKAVCWGLNDGWQLGAASEETNGPLVVAGQP
jgi:alpha-tubulin suppressor-like RCC1 family protein